MRQPVNELAPWGVLLDDGNYVGVQDGGLIASQAFLGRLVFADGSSQTTATSGGFSNPDMGTF